MTKFYNVLYAQFVLYSVPHNATTFCVWLIPGTYEIEWNWQV